MSRATQNFSAYFPNAPAPRSAKDKAKERDKSKTQSAESPGIRPISDSHVLFTTRVGDISATQLTKENSAPGAESIRPSAEDNESVPGDMLNGVGSASSHTSTVSSVFSAPTQYYNISTAGGTLNMSSLTPLTNTESSPLRLSSPKRTVAEASVTTPAISAQERSLLEDRSFPAAQPALADQIPPPARIHARDPNRGIKGDKCTYDPLLDSKIGSEGKRKAKPIYKHIGLVRIKQSAGSVIFFV